MQFVNLIKCYRVFHKMSQRKLAREIGISSMTLNRFESGKEINASAWGRILIWALN